MKKSLRTIGTILCFGIVSLFSNQALAQTTRGSILPGAALNFDGDNDYVSIPDNSSLQISSAFTFESWIKLDAYSYATLISKWDDDNNNRAWFVNLGENGNDDQISVYLSSPNFSNNYLLSAPVSLALHTWYHIAVTFDASLPTGNLKIYINGVQQASGDYNIPLVPNTCNMLLGGYDGSGNGLNAGANDRLLFGSMDETRVWNYARQACDIFTNMTNELGVSNLGLVANYHFNQGLDASPNPNDTILTDASSSANNGNLYNFNLNGAGSNWIAPGGVVSGNTTPISFITPTLPAIHSSCPVTLTPPNAITCGASNYTGTTSDPISYSAPGNYNVNWSFTDGVITDTAVQTISIVPPANVNNIVFSDSICTTGTGSVSFDIAGGYSPYTYSFGSYASGNTSTDTVWADSVIAFSTEYDNPSWAAAQVLGAPDTYPNYGDISTAWTSASSDAGREFLVYHYPPTNATEVAVYVTYNPGFIDTVYVRQAATGNWINIYIGTAGPTVSVAEIEHYPIPNGTGAVDAVRLAMDNAAVGGWNEIDAIGLVPVFQTTISISGFPAGIYTLTITDSSGCSTSSTQMVGAPDNTVTDLGGTFSANQSNATYQWIDCNNSNAPIAGATGQTYTPSANGSYAVVIYSATCVDTSACQNLTNVGINNIAYANSIAVYPNPSAGLFTIENTDLAQVIVYNTLGEIIINNQMEAGKHSINLQSEANGIYFVKVISGSKQQMIKLFKE